MNDQERESNESNERLNRIEATLQQLAELSLKNEFNLAAYRKASDERLARIEELQQRTEQHLNHLSQLAGIFGN